MMQGSPIPINKETDPTNQWNQELLRTVQVVSNPWRQQSSTAAEGCSEANNMGKQLTSAAAGILLLVGVSAAAAQDVIIQPEQDVVIREYVKKKPVASLSLPGVELNIGTALPETVELYEVPDVQYRYVVIEGRTVLVDPGTRKIVKVYD